MRNFIRILFRILKFFGGAKAVCAVSEEDKPPQTPFSFLTHFGFVSSVDAIGKKRYRQKRTEVNGHKPLARRISRHS